MSEGHEQHHEVGRALALAWARHWTAHDVEGLIALFTDDATYEDAALGHASAGKGELRTFFEGTFKTFPDFRLQILNVAADPAFAAAEWEMSGTFLGEMAGQPPTGKGFRVRGCSFMRLRGERIRHHCDYWNALSFKEQTGLGA